MLWNKWGSQERMNLWTGGDLRNEEEDVISWVLTWSCPVPVAVLWRSVTDAVVVNYSNSQGPVTDREPGTDEEDQSKDG